MSSEQGTSSSRRDFIKLAAGTLGGAVLVSGGAGCGGTAGFGNGGGGLGGPVGRGAIPNAYVFYRAYTPTTTGSDPYPDLQTLTGGIFCNDGAVLFHGQRSSGQTALFRMSFDYSGTNAPGVRLAIVLLSQGDQMPDGNTVFHLGSASMNNPANPDFASHAVVIETEGTPGTSASKQGTPILYVNKGGIGYEPLVSLGSPSPDGGQFGGRFGDVAINNNNDVLLVADYSLPSGPTKGLLQGTFLFAFGRNSSSGNVLAQAGSATPGSQLPAQFGLCDLDDQRNYVVQTASQDASRGRGMRTGLIGGAGGGPPQALLGTTGMGRSRVAQVGNMYLGPRIQNGNYTAVAHDDAGNQTLYLNTTQVMTSTGTSPTGSPILGIGPAAIDNNGLTYNLITTQAGMELVVTNGVQQKTILQHGDTCTNDSQPISAIVHGYHSDQVDSQGRIWFVCDFADGTQSLVCGIPV